MPEVREHSQQVCMIYEQYVHAQDHKSSNKSEDKYLLLWIIFLQRNMYILENKCKNLIKYTIYIDIK